MMLLSCTLNLPNISNLPNPETELEHFGRFGIAVRYCNKQQTQPNSANRKLLNFLLNKNDVKKHKAKIAWEEVCVLKEEGGLGLMTSKEWNKVAITKHLWNLLQPHSSSIWVNWVKKNCLKRKNIWEGKMGGESTWLWKKLMNLINEMESKIKIIIGNGTHTSLWFDNWHPNGPLCKKIWRPYNL
ncbi:uncharacterized mitochondrial protein AtMg00310-like isoform X2 [Mangifera indica]|uniref:uncharacterized mitochondrial protein AtMg00310-like isoform X2 n=1 Tax=Mangifera indica TaxID=29780 RepID=UPI001CF94EDB|nr:uncharacterized mitochondrial protein AtMg00310-like isoform X2 [Mangifera indica]